jgi:hypothetical protein
VKAVTEPIGTEHSISVDDGPVADDGSVVKNGIGVERDIVPETAEASDCRATVNAAPRSNDALLADVCKGIDAAIVADASSGMNDGARVNAVRRRFGSAVKMTHDGHKRGHGIGDAEHTQAGRGQPLPSHDSGRLTAIQVHGVFFIFDKRDAPGSRFAERPGGMDQQIPIARQLCLNQFRELPEGRTHRVLSSLKEWKTATEDHSPVRQAKQCEFSGGSQNRAVSKPADFQ